MLNKKKIFADQPGGKSTGSAMIFVGNNLLINYSSKQSVVTTSTFGSELIEVVRATKEIVYVRGILDEFGLKIKDTALIFTDAKVIIDNLNSDIVRKRSKHFVSKVYFLKQHIGWNIISINKIDTKENIADLGTKALAADKYEYLRSKIYDVDKRVAHLGWCVSTASLNKCTTQYNTKEVLKVTYQKYNRKYEKEVKVNRINVFSDKLYLY